MYKNASVLCPYLCFISIIYLDLNVLGYDTSISYGSFMDPTIYLSSSTSEIMVGLVSSNKFKPSVTFLLTAPRRSFFVDHYCFLNFVFVYHTVLLVTCRLVVTCCERADILALSLCLW